MCHIFGILRLPLGSLYVNSDFSLNTFSIDEVVLCNHIQTLDVVFCIFYELWQHKVSCLQPLHQLRPLQVFEVQLCRIETVPIYFFSEFEELESTLKINLIFVETTRLRGVTQATLDSEHVLVSLPWVVNIFLQVLEEILERELTCFAAHVVVQSRFE